jgi:hypothetical protein
MVKEVKYTCDCCGKRVDYFDADGNQMNSGFTRRNNELLCVNVHVPNRCGYSGYNVPQMAFSNLCGPACFKEHAEKWISSVIDAGLSSWPSAVKIPHAHTLQVLGGGTITMHGPSIPMTFIASPEPATLADCIGSDLSQEDMETVVGEYESFGANGYIGDSLLRRTAETYLKTFPLYMGGVTGMMKDITFECFRELTWRFLEPDE